MLKIEFKEFASAVVIAATAFIMLALLGTNPLDHTATLERWVRVCFAILGGLGFAALVAARLMPVRTARSDQKEPSQEYKERFEHAQKEIASIRPELRCLAEAEIGGVRFSIENGDLKETKADIVSSSDDNRFSARGGVAKAIIAVAGPSVEQQLAEYTQQHKFRQGQLVVTTGGKSKWRAIIHPAVIDVDEDRYPTPDVIRAITEKCLVTAESLGGERLAFPILGGGTASKNITPQKSASVMTEAILEHLQSGGSSLRTITLYAFRADDANDAAKSVNACATAPQAAPSVKGGPQSGVARQGGSTNAPPGGANTQ